MSESETEYTTRKFVAQSYQWSELDSGHYRLEPNGVYYYKDRNRAEVRALDLVERGLVAGADVFSIEVFPQTGDEGELQHLRRFGEGPQIDDVFV